MADNELVLKQRNALGFNTQIKLINGRELQVINKNKNFEQVYSVDILSLKEKSKLTVLIAWKWLATAITVFALTLLTLQILSPYLLENKNMYLAIILLLGLLACILSVFQFWKCSSIQQIFFSKNAHVPIVKLSKGKPTKEKFSVFINSIEQRIKQFQRHMNIDEEKQLAGEMKMLRRLSDTGIISKKSYELAKAKLFSEFDS